MSTVSPQTSGPATQTFVVTQHFSAPPDLVWPLVSDTDRLNRATGLAEANGTYGALEGGRVLIGHAKQQGFSLEWVEHPFEYVAGERLAVLREYRSGPPLWVRSVVELTPQDGGTRLTHTIEAQPRSLLFIPVIAAEIGIRLRRALSRAYGELEQWLSQPPHQRSLEGPFAKAEPLSSAAERELDRGLNDARARGAGDFALAALESILRSGDPMELAHLRPLELAWRSGIFEDDMIDACLLAADAGLLQMRWELLCPHCRTSAQRLDTPEQLDAPGFCEACEAAIGVDPMSSVELVFQPHPAVRQVEAGTYCLGSPAHLPHVVAQHQLRPGKELKLELRLGSGAWALTWGPGLGVELEISDDAESTEAVVDLSNPPPRLSLAAHRQSLVISNPSTETLRVRVESGVMRASVLTAARAAARSLDLRPETPTAEAAR